MNNTILPQNITTIVNCQCGSITVYTDDGREYCCKKENFKQFFPNIDRRTTKPKTLDYTMCFCNHCVNHWGLDICSCGSGENVGECECGSKTPYQTIGQDNYKHKSAWI